MNDFLKEALSHDWIMKYITELIATAFLLPLVMVRLPMLSLQGNKKVTNLVGLLSLWLWFCGNDASTYVW